MLVRFFPGLFVIVGLLVAPSVQAQPKPYVVENVKIALKGLSPVEARDKAMEAAQNKALKALIKGLNNGQDLPFDSSRVPGLIEDFELVDEQIAPDKYSAVYTFRFKRYATQELVREIQYQQGIPVGPTNQTAADSSSTNMPYSDLFSAQSAEQQPYSSHLPSPTSAPLLLPYWKSAGTPVLWGDQNLWKNTWRNMEIKAAAENRFVLPIGDLADMRETSDGLPENPQVISHLRDRYQTNDIVIAVGERAVSSITTTLYKIQQDSLVFWKVIDSPIGPDADPYSVAAGQVMAELSGNSHPQITSQMPAIKTPETPIAQNTVYTNPKKTDPFFIPAEGPGNTLSTIQAYSQFQTPKEWMALKAAMTPENGIREIRVLSLMPKSAVVELHLFQSLEDVQRQLAPQGVSLKPQNAAEGSGYVLSYKGS